MNCSHAQRLLHLNHPGERTEKEQRLLDQHLRTCETCRGAARRIEAVSALRSAAEFTPELQDPERSLSRILSAVSATPQAAPARRDAPSVTVGGRPAGAALVRYAAAAVVVLMVGGFLLQTWELQREVAALEQSIAAPAASAGTIAVGFLIDPGRLQDIGPSAAEIAPHGVESDQPVFLPRRNASALLRKAAGSAPLPTALSGGLPLPHPRVAMDSVSVLSLRLIFTGV